MLCEVKSFGALLGFYTQIETHTFFTYDIRGLLCYIAR